MKTTPRFKGWIWALCLGVLGVAAAGWMNRGTGDGTDLPFATATYRDLEVAVRTVGVLDAARSHMLSSDIRGDKGKIIFLVADGTRVREGDVLVRLDPTPFEEEIRRLSDEVRNLKAAVEAEEQMVEWEKNQVEKEIKTAEFNVKVAQLEHDRLVEGEGPIQLTQYRTEMEKAGQEQEKYTAYIRDLEQLNTRGGANLSELTLAKQKLAELKELRSAAESKYNSYKDHMLPSLEEAALAQIEKTRMELEKAKNSGVYQIAKATAALNKSRSKLGTTESDLLQARRELEKTAIKAPFQGIAILFEAFRDGQQRKPRIGDQVWQNQPLLYLPDITSMIVKTRVREIDLHKVFLGMTCDVTVDAYPEAMFKGEVSFIGVLAMDPLESGSAEKYFQIAITVKGDDPRLRPGMTARTKILSEQIQNALCIPIQAVFPEEGNTFCYVLTGGSIEKKPIATAAKNEDFAQVTEGLAQGDRVALIKPDLQKTK